MQLTVADVKASRIPPALGLCPDDPKLLAWLNEGEERLLTAGLWWCTYAKFRICATAGCITLPPQIAVIEQAAQNTVPIPVHDQWFEFLENGFGTRSPLASSCGANNSSVNCNNWCNGLPEADHRGFFATFSDIVSGTNNTPKKLRWVCDVSADVGSTVTVMGYDNNGNWIRTQVAGVWQDGETIALAQSAGTLSVTNFSSITGIQFPAPRKGQCWLYEYDTVATTSRLIGQYQYWETRPHYARYLIPSITSCSTSGSCPSVMVEIIAKLDHLPLVNDSDYLVVNSLPALKFIMQAIKKEEDGVTTADLQEAVGYESKAIAELEKQLDHYLGQGRRMGLTIVGADLARNNPIEQLL